MADERGGVPFPLYPWNEIIPGLWMGGHVYLDHDGIPMPATIRDEFDIVFSLHRERNPRFQPPTHIAHYYVPLDDEHSMSAGRLRDAKALATRVANAHTTGYRVLVRCHAGYNRSGLIVGLALRQLGWDAPDAVELIRHQRSVYALHNPYFVELIHNHTAEVPA